MFVTTPRAALLVSLSLLTSVAACGAGKAGEAVRPNDPTAAGALGGPPATCHEVGKKGTPLIVDWKPESRSDLEVVMKEGVAIVHYDCDSVDVLTDCHAEGQYAFVGVTRKEELVVLENADQAQASLPLSGAKLGASLARGSSIDIGLVMVGKKSTPFLGVDQSMLKGKCEGATHFVRSATLGAFAMKTSTNGSVSAAAQVFGAGVSGGSSSDKSTSNKDGDPDACKTADPDGPKAPSNCGALLRVELLALDGSAAKDTATLNAEVACPKGLVAVKGGNCTAPDTQEAHDCDIKSIADCEKQCALGSAMSCSWAALVYSLGVDVKEDDAKSAKLDEKGCDNGGAPSCQGFGLDLLRGLGVAKDEAKGTALLVRACNSGFADACGTLGWLYMGGMKGVGVATPVDMAKSTRYYQRGCDSGAASACAQLGQNLVDGTNGLAADKAKGTSLLERACLAKDSTACKRLGKPVPK